MYRSRTPDLQRFAVLPEHEEAGGVIDLRVHQDDGSDAGVAQTPRGLQRGEAADLLQYVRGGVDQYPVKPVVTDGDR